MSAYIPYSIRHNITDKDLAGLLDYLERVMGWDIKYYEYRSSSSTGISCLPSFDIFIFPSNCTGKYSVTMQFYGNVLSMPKALFFATYRTLLPEIRNLYSK